MTKKQIYSFLASIPEERIIETLRNNDFKLAKEYWGETIKYYQCPTCGEIQKGKNCCKGESGVSRYPIHTWKYHLQKMIVAQDILEYLRRTE